MQEASFFLHQHKPTGLWTKFLNNATFINLSKKETMHKGK
jgi:hypothetical protein